MNYAIGRLYWAQREIDRLIAGHLINPARVSQNMVRQAINREERMYQEFKKRFPLMLNQNIYNKINRLKTPATRPRTPPKRR